MLQHPDWRRLAQEYLVKDPELKKDLQKSGQLQTYLDEKAERARAAFEVGVQRALEKNPGEEMEMFVTRAVEESVIHDLIDPTT